MVLLVSMMARVIVVVAMVAMVAIAARDLVTFAIARLIEAVAVNAASVDEKGWITVVGRVVRLPSATPFPSLKPWLIL